MGLGLLVVAERDDRANVVTVAVGRRIVGGLLLIAGVLTRWAGGALSLIMLGAIALVHLKAGFFNPYGVEFPLSLLAATVALTLAGPGRYRVPGLPA